MYIIWLKQYIVTWNKQAWMCKHSVLTAQEFSSLGNKVITHDKNTLSYKLDNTDISYLNADL